jgi:glycosyltransferase involved in cell wall biosynthesis
MKPLLLAQCPVATRSGYGEHSRDILRSLIKMDKFDIVIWGMRWGDTPYIDLDTDRDREIFKRLLNEPNLPKQPDVYVQVTVPNEFQKIGKYNIGITAGIETTVCSTQWIEGMNRMDMVIVPSVHSKTVFDKSVYTKTDNAKRPIGELKTNVPIEILFEGVDTDIFNFNTNIKESELRFELNNIAESFAFLFVGHWLKGDMYQDRKDVSGLIKVFLETFKNTPSPPALVLKTSAGSPSVMDRNEILSRIDMIKKSVSNNKYLPNIYVLHGDLTTQEMNSLYNHTKIKAHISFTKGEGFGRPLLEASMSEKPIIAPNWSGHVDFLQKEYCTLLPGELTKIHPSAVWENVIIPESSWFTTNYTAASNAMIQVWKNYAQYKRNAEMQARYSRENFSLEKMHTKFGEILEKYLPKFAEEIPIVMPDFSTLQLPKLKPMTPVAETIKDDMHQLDMKQVDLPQQPTETQMAVDASPKPPVEDEIKINEQPTTKE